jgi:hypothetical protein
MKSARDVALLSDPFVIEEKHRLAGKDFARGVNLLCEHRKGYHS